MNHREGGAMKDRQRGSGLGWWGVLCAAAALAPVGCDDGNGNNGASEQLPACAPVRSAEPIPLLRFLGGSTVTVTFDALTSRIDARCQQCHLLTRTGGFQYMDVYSSTDPDRPGLAEAADRMDMMILAGKMPPNDPDPEGSKLLGLVLQAWIQAGKPQEPFQAPASLPDQGQGAFPRLPTDRAEVMSNLGSCVPDPQSTSGLLRPDPDKDAFFAGATTLPTNLSDTDFTTLDMAALAKKGLFAYAPTYQLWSDDARKLRMVRVPKGQKITFDPATRRFTIPPNTRFYKTFFKQVVEPDGHIGYRAIETRLIVSRPSQNGVEQAIFGTYLWDEHQTGATLWQEPYRDGTPF